MRQVGAGGRTVAERDLAGGEVDETERGYEDGIEAVIVDALNGVFPDGDAVGAEVIKLKPNAGSLPGSKTPGSAAARPPESRQQKKDAAIARRTPTLGR